MGILNFRIIRSDETPRHFYGPRDRTGYEPEPEASPQVMRARTLLEDATLTLSRAEKLHAVVKEQAEVVAANNAGELQQSTNAVDAADEAIEASKAAIRQVNDAMLIAQQQGGQTADDLIDEATQAVDDVKRTLDAAETKSQALRALLAL